MNWFRLKNCIKCQGDLASDEGDWTCLQYGTYYYTGLYLVPTHLSDSQAASGVGPSQGLDQPVQKGSGPTRAPLLPEYTQPTLIPAFAPITTAIAKIAS